ncbi:adaptin N terminal region-domain-containing protein [Globomyces pollinis-pini]|nr:adaptin N terminal region-domain-containing protein [Globomyces pollinis-pini]
MDLNLNKLTSMIPVIGQTSLKDLIKSIRLCKTASDERAVIQKESANIRTAFKEENNMTRYINIEKLLYIHMLGYPAHFGQIECLKLAASPRFADKKLAYLGTMLLLDENQATLTLVTNCLKNDMNNSNMYIVGLALCTLGNIASQEMSRDLSGEVERLLGNSNSYVRKKACLTALRIIRKVPDLADHFLERAVALLSERNHGVLLTGVTLLEQMCVDSEEIKQSVRGHVSFLCRHLKTLVAGGSSPEHDVNGITDPFLQVKILRLLRVLGKGSQTASEAMNDVLAQVATTTEASKNVGNSILYETVLTIMNIESDSSLRVLGINILGRFLQNRDNNIKYVALTTLTKTSQTAEAADVTALQRHRATVLDCLRDPDISIRRRALDLSFYLITPANIRILTRELLSFLEVAENDSKSSISTRICDYAGRYRPNKRWEIDTVIRVLRVAGQYVDQSVINHFVKLVTTGDRVVYQYAVEKLYRLIKDQTDTILLQEGLLQAAFWCLGEYGDILTTSSGAIVGFGTDEDNDGESQEISNTPTQMEVTNTIITILNGPYATSFVMEYGVNALVKLAARFKQDDVLMKIKSVIKSLKVNIDVEIQQRAVEYDQIFNLDADTRFALLEHMPVLESAVTEEALKGTGTAAGVVPTTSPTKKSFDLIGDISSNAGAPQVTQKDDIMDLLGGLNLTGSAPTAIPALQATQPQVQTQATVDLLGDLFGSGPTPPVQSPNKQEPTPLSNPSPTYPPIKCYEKNGLVVTLTPIKESSTITQIKATFYATVSITNLLFQVAVPKNFKLLMQPASSSNITPNGQAFQLMKIENSTKTTIRLRIKLSYTVDNQNIDEIAEFGSFDPSLWS